jgi:formylglycine-generating enzyme required for sulfatase activity
MADGQDRGRGVGLVALAIVLVLLGFVAALPSIGIGYCLYSGNPSCPALLSPQATQSPVAQSPATPAGTASDNRGTKTPSASTPSLVRTGATAGAPPVSSSDYIALVIGNSGYTPPNDLNNPRNDAQDVATALQDLGYRLVGGAPQFDVESKRDMLALLDQFTVEADAAKVALIYYAGHGVQFQGENYLIPTKATLKTARQLNLQAVSMREINAALPAQKISVVIFDACRSPPTFPLVGDDGKLRGNDTRGLGVVRAPNRSYFAFSSSSGEPAKDGVGRNSPNVTRLLARMREPGIEIETVFKKVQDDFRDTDANQRPDNSDQLGVVQVPFAPALPLPPPGTEFRDCPDCPLMVVVPKGRFLMGAPASEEGASEDERPQHEVTIPADFAVGKFEVTFAEYDACVAAGGCIERPDDRAWGRGTRPVMNVNWADAQTYIRWLNARLGSNRGKYRLLSEAEWEYAARAGTTTAYPWGEKASHEFANYGKDECCDGLAQGRDKWVNISPVGSFPANRFGLHDMHGNVFEWTEDCWNESYKGAPADGRPRTTGECSRRVLRCGSWSYNPRYLRSALRFRGDSTYRFVSVGFRLARTN